MPSKYKQDNSCKEGRIKEKVCDYCMLEGLNILSLNVSIIFV
jgi:hypothetical protein